MRWPSADTSDRTSPVGHDGDCASEAYGRYVLGMLAFVSVINSLDRSLWSVLVIPVKADLQLSDTQLGVLGGFAFALFYATVGLPLARLADRRKRVSILSICAALWSAATATCGIAQSFVTMFLARVGVGVGEAGCLPSSHSILADYYPPGRRAFALGLFEAAGGIGVMLGIMLAGVLSDQVGWRATFVLVGLPGILVALLVRFTVREPVRGRLDPPRSISAQHRVNVRALVSRVTYRRIVLAMSLCVLGYYGILQWLPSFLSRSHGLSSTTIGLTLGVAFGIGSILGASMGAFLSPVMIRRDRRWELRLPGVSFALSAPVFLLAFQLSSAELAIAVIFFGSLILSIGFAPALASVQSVAEPEVRATAVAIVMFASALVGQGGGPALVGLLSDTLARTAGSESLRLALSVYTVVLVLAGARAWTASRTMAQDLVN